MSSACVCHTDQWCFYCNMYLPLEEKYEKLLAKVGRIHGSVESMHGNALIACRYDKAAGYENVLNLLEEVLNDPNNQDRQHTSEP